jgi:hypothetical protein
MKIGTKAHLAFDRRMTLHAGLLKLVLARPHLRRERFDGGNLRLRRGNLQRHNSCNDGNHCGRHHHLQHAISEGKFHQQISSPIGLVVAGRIFSFFRSM